MSTPQLSEAQSLYFDVLRVLAAEVVLLTHVIGFAYGDSALTYSLGSLGVSVFFLLSGFLITYSALSKHSDSNYGLADFLSDRFFRIYAAFLPALLFVAAADSFLVESPLFKYPEHTGAIQFLGNLFMLQDFPVFTLLAKLGLGAPWFIAPYGSAGPFWTISIEFWIYVTFGLVYFSLRAGRSLLSWPTGPVLLLAAIAPVYQLAGGFGECLTLLWLLGCAAAVIFIHHARLSALLCWEGVSRQKIRRIAGLLIGLCAFLLAARGVTAGLQWYDLQTSLFTAVMLFSGLACLGGSARPRGLFDALWRRAADYSYSLYLTHATVILAIVVALEDNPDRTALMIPLMVAANLFAFGFWFVFERHYPAQSRWFRGWIRRRGLVKDAAPRALSYAD